MYYLLSISTISPRTGETSRCGPGAASGRATARPQKAHAIMIKLPYLNTNSSPIAAICLPCVKARRGEVARQAKTTVRYRQLQTPACVCVSTDIFAKRCQHPSGS